MCLPYKLTFIEHLLCGKHESKHFTYIDLLKFPLRPSGASIIITPFDKQGNGGTQHLNNLPKVTQSASREAWLLIQGGCIHNHSAIRTPAFAQNCPYFLTMDFKKPYHLFISTELVLPKTVCSQSLSISCRDVVRSAVILLPLSAQSPTPL